MSTHFVTFSLKGDCAGSDIQVTVTMQHRHGLSNGETTRILQDVVDAYVATDLSKVRWETYTPIGYAEQYAGGALLCKWPIEL